MMKCLRGLLVLVVLLGAGCTSDPIEGDEASEVVKRCCEQVRSKVKIAKDIESDQFEGQCGACRRGESKARCGSAAEKLQHTVKTAYGDEVTPYECTTMRKSLQELGIGGISE